MIMTSVDTNSYSNSSYMTIINDYFYQISLKLFSLSAAVSARSMCKCSRGFMLNTIVR
jgi:hypothetical protein